MAFARFSDIANADDAPEFSREKLEFFEKQVRPLLVERCFSCHSRDAKRLEAGLYVDSRSGLIAGGDSGKAIFPGNPSESLFMEAVRYESYEMPPKGQLPDNEIAIFDRWIKMGAPWPKDSMDVAAPKRKFDLQARSEEHWVWKPVEAPSPPPVVDRSWPRNDLDRFVLARLNEQGLEPSADSDRLALIRRLYFDLTGLPPSAEVVSSFNSDSGQDATDRVVDELLDSPRFGERWARHWLDLVRYAESRGHEFDDDIPNAYQYRDYLIRAFNADLPYDQLIREHIAGDLLEHPRMHPRKQYNESVLGTGFWFLGESVHSPVDIRKDESDRFDNMIDVMSKTFLGVTVACARCHDHKFDAISTADYYSLTGFLHSSDYRQVRFESIEHNRDIARRLKELDDAFGKKLIAGLSKAGLKPPKPSQAPASCQSIVDYGRLGQDEFLQDGFVYGSGPLLPGGLYWDGAELEVATRGVARNDSFWDGIKSISEGKVQNNSKLSKLPKSGRTLRTPTFELTNGNVACLVNGEGHVVACVDSHRHVAGPLHGETIQAVQPGERWVRMNLDRYIGHRLHLEFIPASNKRLEVSVVVQGATNAQLTAILKQLDDDAKPFEKYAEAVGELLSDESQSKSELVGNAQDIIDRWRRERHALQHEVKVTSRLAPAMLDGSGEDAHIYIRGNAGKHGEVIPRRFLSAVKGDRPMRIKSGSGRLQLAEQIADPKNPLTYRVVVNRVWHYLMGRGIVPTTDDFGVLGQAPTHPLLLDHLTDRFIRDGCSIKKLIRYIVLSRTYRMSSIADAEALSIDPNNLSWHHRPPKRLEGEAIRDALLSLSGRLDETPFGPSAPIHLTPFMEGRGRPKTNGSPDGEGRRSIYVSVRRNFLSPFMLAFDTPVPFSTMGRRNVSNVPAQALILMNDPFVYGQARDWGKRAIEIADDRDDRVSWLYLSGLARLPTGREKAVAKVFVGESDEVDRWAAFAHGLINTKEFIFLK
ncbi:MAG TPA: hypothetical protein DDW52_28670 [Planctomycetaceae bacterium]|nr:hypothetical protein [Planctomycetaceae bacterium]